MRKRSTCTPILAGCAAALALGLRAPAARGDERLSGEARRRLDRGIALYVAGKYDEAVRELRAGLLIANHPDLWYALGQSERKRGDCAKAIEAYRIFLRASPPADEAHRAEANIARCEDANDRRPEPSAPLLKPAPPEDAPAPRPPPPAPDQALRVIGVGVLAMGGVLIGIGTYFAVRAASNWDTINEAARNHEAWSVDLQRRYESADATESNATVLFVAGAATAVAGGVLFYLGRAPPASGPGPVPAYSPSYPPRLALRFGEGTGTLTLRWAF